MLVLSRLPQERIAIGNDIEVKVLEVRGQTVRLGITAPRQVPIQRVKATRDVAKEHAEWMDPQRFGDDED